MKGRDKMSFVVLYIVLCFVNVVLQTVKSLCTVKCSTFISACANAIAYGLYTYVIVFTNADGISLFCKALICASTNFVGVYMANFIFKMAFSKPIRWKVEISMPVIDAPQFLDSLDAHGIEYYTCGYWEDWVSYAVFCPTHKESKIVKSILPDRAKYNIRECAKTL